MSFVMGSSCFLNPPLHHPYLPSPSSQCSLLYLRNAEKQRKHRIPMASLGQEGDPNDTISCKRRAVLFVGISVLPFLSSSARALQDLATESRSRVMPRRTFLGHILRRKRNNGDKIIPPIPTCDERDVKTPEKIKKAEQALLEGSPPNSFLSLLNGLGVLASGVLGSLYALNQKEKAASQATMESIKSKLKEKEAVIVSLEKDFGLKLLNEEKEQAKQLGKAKEELQSLMNQVQSANSIIAGLRQELQSEKRLIQDLKAQMDNLQTDLGKAREDKKGLEDDLKQKLESIEVLQDRVNLLGSEIKDKEDNVEKLSSSLAHKELEFNNLVSDYNQSKNQLLESDMEIKGLKDELWGTQKELESKNSMVDDLNAQVDSLIVEKEDSNRQLAALQTEFNDLKLSSEKKEALNAKLLGEKEKELHQLEEKIEHALNEVRKGNATIAELTQEKEDLSKLLATEVRNVKNLKYELQITQEALKTSANEASDLEKQVNKLRDLCLKLEAQVSTVQAESAKAEGALRRNLDEAKQSSEVLAGELMTVKELLNKTKSELQEKFDELTSVTENRDSLQQELVDIYKKAESVAQDLKDEKKTVTTLNKEIQTLEKQISKDKEVQKALKTDLEEATKSLDEVNEKVFLLSKDLEFANARLSSLEDEKAMVQNALAEQKNFTQEARENIEDAHNLVMRLGKERESLEKRSKKLEEELAAAKGEILRLRSEIKAPKTRVNNKIQQGGESESEAEAEGNTAPVRVKRSGRRRKSSSPQ